MQLTALWQVAMWQCGNVASNSWPDSLCSTAITDFFDGRLTSIKSKSGGDASGATVNSKHGPTGARTERDMERHSQ